MFCHTNFSSRSSSHFLVRTSKMFECKARCKNLPSYLRTIKYIALKNVMKTPFMTSPISIIDRQFPFEKSTRFNSVDDDKIKRVFENSQLQTTLTIKSAKVINNVYQSIQLTSVELPLGIKSAGVILHCVTTNRILMVCQSIEDRKVWSFPKGTFDFDKDASIMGCAEREFKEETNMSISLGRLAKHLFIFKGLTCSSFYYYVPVQNEAEWSDLSFTSKEISQVAWMSINTFQFRANTLEFPRNKQVTNICELLKINKKKVTKKYF